MNWDRLTGKKEQLDGHRPLPAALVQNLDDWFRVELTYTSNAIEGNTLSRRETALVVHKGITVGGKSLVEHLEATNHMKALAWVEGQSKRRPQQICEPDILAIHELILKGIDDANTGHYRQVPVRLAGSMVVLPNHRKVPDLMEAFAAWLKSSRKLHPVELAAEAHYRLVTIHPFVDGNGRTGRLLMNLILLMSGYPPAIIRKRDRLAYIESLERSQLGGPKDSYLDLIFKSVNRSLNIYLKAAGGETPEANEGGRLLKIGELAQATKVNVSTIRHWTKTGLLEVAEVTDAGYQLYSDAALERIELINRLKSERYTLSEIAKKLAG